MINFDGFPTTELPAIVSTAIALEAALPGRDLTFYRVWNRGELFADIRTVNLSLNIQTFYRTPLKTALAPSNGTIAFIASRIKQIEMDVSA